jgi:Rieske Fe-S protein
MNKIILAVGLVVAFVLVVSPAMAADVTVKGTVSVVKDDAGKITAVKITTKDGDKEVVYSVTLNPEGKKLAHQDGKEVEVKGTVHEKEGAKTLTIKPAAAEKAPEPK